MNKDRLPQGNNIRQLLVKSNITDYSIQSFLKSKGVFISSYDKNVSVPLLMKTLVSPDDFENLYEIQKSKEESVKHRTAIIKCNKDFNLADVLNKKIELNKAIKEAHKYQPDYKIIGNPTFFIEKDGSAQLSYKIERENVLNDWTDNKTYHTGQVRIEKSSNGDIDISIQQDSTSKETFIINNLILSYVKEVFEQKSLIDLGEKFETIRFMDFSNKNRIKFLYSFIQDFSVYTKFHSLTDINIYLDQTVQGHADLEKFLKELDNLRLKGKALQNHIFINSDAYHDKLLFTALRLKYKLTYNGIEGWMFLYLSFPDYIKKKSVFSEFQVEISFSLGRLSKKASTEKLIRNKLLVFIEKLKMEMFEKFKEDHK